MMLQTWHRCVISMCSVQCKLMTNILYSSLNNNKSVGDTQSTVNEVIPLSTCKTVILYTNMWKNYHQQFVLTPLCTLTHMHIHSLTQHTPYMRTHSHTHSHTRSHSHIHGQTHAHTNMFTTTYPDQSLPWNGICQSWQDHIHSMCRDPPVRI